MLVARLWPAGGLVFDSEVNPLSKSVSARPRRFATMLSVCGWRTETALAEGKKALARKDLERVLAEDAYFPGLDRALTQLDDT